jgi:hypothetical protein
MRPCDLDQVVRIMGIPGDPVDEPPQHRVEVPEKFIECMSSMPNGSSPGQAVLASLGSCLGGEASTVC